MNRYVELIVLLPEIKRCLAFHLAAKDFRFLQAFEERVIQRYIKGMSAYRKAFQVNDIVVIFAHYAKSGAKVLLFFELCKYFCKKISKPRIGGGSEHRSRRRDGGP